MAILSGDSTNNILSGTTSADLISGGSGDDSLSGGNGNDLLLGGSGDDYIDGGNGNDFLFGGSGDDAIDGGNGNDFVDGGSGDDVINGGNGNDLLYGDSGNDLINGGNGSDLIFGGSGNDVLIGVGGADWMQGGTGNDVFSYQSASDSNASGWDRITDFTQGKDKIDLSELLGQTIDLTWGDKTATANGAWYQNSGSSTFVFADTNNDGMADLKIELKNTFGLKLNASDFIGVGANWAPVATAGTAQGDEDTVINGTLFASDPDGGTLNYNVVNGPAHGTLVLNTNGAYSYIPDANFNGSDEFTFKANDGSSDSNFATVALTVNPVNDAPVAQNLSGATDEDTAFNGTLAATDIDVEHLSYSIVAPVDGVTVQQSGSYRFDPRGLYDSLGESASTEISFQYVANDGTVDSAPATVTISLAGVNDAPVAVADEADASAGSASGNVLTNVFGRDFDPDNGDSLKVTALEGVAPGDLVYGKFGFVIMDGDGFGNWSYKLTADVADGTRVEDVFNYTIEDAHGAVDSSTLTIHVTGTGGASVVTSVTSSAAVTTVTDTPVTNTAPVAVADEVSVKYGGANGNVLANDMDLDTGDSLVVTSVNGNPDGLGDLAIGAYGFLMLTDTGDWTYQLSAAGTDVVAQGGTADDVFGYTMADTDGASASSTLTIHIGDFIL